MTEERLACWRVKDLAIPNPDSVRGYSGECCGEELWVRQKNTTLQMKFVCRQCAAELAAKDMLTTGEPTVVLPAAAAHVLTPYQLRELEAEVKARMMED